MADKDRAHQLDSSEWKQFEIEAYRIEQQLAFEKNRYQTELHAVLNSRAWRWTRPAREAAGLVIRFVLKFRFGVRALQWLSKRI